MEKINWMRVDGFRDAIADLERGKITYAEFAEMAAKIAVDKYRKELAAKVVALRSKEYDSRDIVLLQILTLINETGEEE